MSGRASKRKGSAEERAIVKFFESFGWRAKRVPLSGGAEGWPGDVRAYAPNGKEYRIESKRRASGDGFKTLRRWLGDNDFLWLREDRCEGMIVMSTQKFRELVEQGARNEQEADLHNDGRVACVSMARPALL